MDHEVKVTDSRGPPPRLEVERQRRGLVVTGAAMLMAERGREATSAAGARSGGRGRRGAL